jgi:hypothetical protein
MLAGGSASGLATGRDCIEKMKNPFRRTEPPFRVDYIEMLCNSRRRHCFAGHEPKETE